MPETHRRRDPITTRLATSLAVALALVGACTNPSPPPAIADDVTLAGPTAAAPITPPPPVAISAAPTGRAEHESVIEIEVPEPSPVTSTTNAPPVVTSSAPPAPATAGIATQEGDRILPLTAIAYMTGKALLRAESSPALAEVKLLLDAKPAITLVRVEVHTDSMGQDDANQALSDKRALEVARGLVKLGVSCKRLLPVGFGETKPIVANTTAEDRARNRRTEFVVVALRGRNIGGLTPDGGGKVAGDPCC